MLVNEFEGNWFWLGSFYFVVIYGCVFFVWEVLKYYWLGKDVVIEECLGGFELFVNEWSFEEIIVLIFVKYCFECYDILIWDGGLNLLWKEVVKLGGESGLVWSEGDVYGSLFWELIVNDEMFFDWFLFLDEEKDVVCSWIEDGVDWIWDVFEVELFV